MQTLNRNTFTTLRTEGAILPPDLLQRISEGDSDLGGLKPKSFHLLSGEKINEATNRAWNRLAGAWSSFQEAREHLSEDDPGTTITRERWLLPLFQELDYGRLQTSRAIGLDGKSYPISHTWGQVPIHLVGCNIDLDRRTAGVAGAARTSPHSLVQELLNRSDDYLWSFLSNGLHLRILRDNASLTRQAYAEFDLEAMLEGEVYADFVLLWLLCHQSRVEGDNPAEFWLEKWSRYAQEQGTRALDQLRDGVEDAISALGRGFLSHPANQVLRSKLRQGDLSTQDYYRQLLRMVYRLIFLFVAEDRELLFDPEARQEARQRYTRYYSTSRLRRLAGRRRGGRHADLFVGSRLVMEKLGAEAGCRELGLPPLGSFLFSEESVRDIITCQISNSDLLEAIRSLAYTVDGHGLRPVDYKNLGPEEIGSVYESLLELHPEINVDARTFSLTTASGHERRTTGSYYTPSSLIQVLLDSALDPLIEERLRRVKSKGIEEQEQALLDIKVCDPASGSGHFLIAAAHRIAKVLAGVRTGDDEPSPEATRHALRDVISHCIYGVDVNPMAVELCKVSLWMEALEPGKPLSFLDTHIKCGNSLVGVGPGLDISEIPDDAFQPAFGDDKTTATGLRRRNKREREGQLGFRWDQSLIKDREHLKQWLANNAKRLETMPEDEARQVQTKVKAYQEYVKSYNYTRSRLEFDLWTAAFFWPIPKCDAERILAPTQQEMLRLRTRKDLDVELLRRIRELAEQHSFFHWKFEFPAVFANKSSGFDLILGNPPWEMEEVRDQEFFSNREPNLARNMRTIDRRKLISELNTANPSLYAEYESYVRFLSSSRNFYKYSNRFPLGTIGRLNLYRLFLEGGLSLITGEGRYGQIIPAGIATDSFTQGQFKQIISQKKLEVLYHFENEDMLFPGIHHATKFCIIVLVGNDAMVNEADIVCYCRNIDVLRDETRHWTLSRNLVETINPNSWSAPLFASKKDAEITLKIHSNAPILIDESGDEVVNLWKVTPKLQIMMNDERILDKDRLESIGFQKRENYYYHPENDSNKYLPLYEGKMIWQFDHRFGTYEGQTKAQANQNKLPELTTEQHLDPHLIIQPRYWVHISDVKSDMKPYSSLWFMAFRDITSSVVLRTCIFCIIPFASVGNTAPLILNDFDSSIQLCLLGEFNSLVLDFVARQKIGGTHLTFTYLKQLPIIPPSRFRTRDIDFIAKRVFELTYTAWDLQSFAQDMGYDGPPFRWEEDRRAQLRAELDAYYARLYGVDREELRYILDPQDVYGPDFPSEAFRVLKEKEIKQCGEYRTRRLVLEAWDRMQEAVDSNTDYVPMADPPPAHPSLAHPNRDGSVYKGPGLVIDTEPIGLERPRPTVKEQPTGYERKAREKTKEEKPAAKEKPTEISDYGLYKCSGCGQMVLGFDKENHVQLLHGGEEQEFVRL